MAVVDKDGVVPEVGDIWCWEPLTVHAEQVVVTAVRRNTDDEVWIESANLAGNRYWNELSRWVEATVLVKPANE